MKVKPQQQQQNQNNIIPNPAWNSTLESCTNPTDREGYRQDIDRATNSSETCSLPRSQYRRVEDYTEEVQSFILSRPICVQTPDDNGMSDFNSMDMCFDGSWRSPASSDLSSVSDVNERKLSTESIDSEILPSSLDTAPSLDDVFDVLGEMDPFEPDLTMNAHAPLSAPSTPFMSQFYWSDSLYQPPVGSRACNTFIPFHFDLVNNLQNPSRGLITAMRRLCELLSKPRSDHLESVFVRLLNNTLNDMEEAAQPQSKRPRRNYERLPVSKRKRPNKSKSDAESGTESANIGLSRACTSKSHSLSVISSRVDNCVEIVDLTGCGDCEEQQQHDSKETPKKQFIALEDTMSAFIESFFYKSFTKNSAHYQETSDKLDCFVN